MSGKRDDETFLPGRGEVRKSHPLLEALGAVDELSAFVGVARSLTEDEELRKALKTVQEALFNIGSYLAVPNRPLDRVRLCMEELKTFEKLMESRLPALTRFIYPGGAEAAAFMNVCRAVARRAERTIVKLSETMEVDPLTISFLNFLSKFFFTAARYINHLSGVADEEWFS
ncbi:MAG: cob(I)yrinic acid a,c-diamide adenosyltransferase [Candidatus Caldarchaeum sp.]